MGTFSVVAAEVASTGSSIEADASGLTTAVNAMNGVSGVDEPAQTSRALASLQLRWSAGVGRLQDDLERFGQGTQAASTLYTQTDEAAMGP